MSEITLRCVTTWLNYRLQKTAPLVQGGFSCFWYPSRDTVSFGTALFLLLKRSPQPEIKDTRRVHRNLLQSSHCFA